MFLQLLLVQWLPGQSSLWAVKAHTRTVRVYTVSQKKQDTKLLAVTSPTIIRFSKFFH